MRTSVNITLSFILAVLFAPCFLEQVDASLSNISPDAACGLLDNMGLATRGWQHYYDDEFGCKSQSLQFGSPKLLRNDLFYYVQGTSGTIDEIVLVLSVNNIDEADQAHNLFLEVAQKLLMKVSNEPMPDNMVQAILHGKNYSFISDSITVTIKISYWIMKSKKLNSVISKGYEFRCTIR